jgi:hypothetical protein
MPDDDKSQDRHLAHTLIAGQNLRTKRTGHNYGLHQWRSSGKLVIQIYEDQPPGAGLPRPADAIAEIFVTKGALPRVLDVLDRYDHILGLEPEVRTRLSNLDPALPEDTGEREPFRDQS